MPVRCVVTLQAIETTSGWSGPGSKLYKLRMSPIADSKGKYKEFFQATPSGSIELGTVNAEAAQFFEFGKEYYLDFSPAD